MTVPPSRWPEAAATLGRTFGVRGVRLRAAHEVRRRFGRFRSAPIYPATGGVPAAWLRPDADALAEATDRAVALDRAERVLAGEHQAYRHGWRALPDTAEAWRTHPTTGHAFPNRGPWWRVAHLDPEAGDIKDVWEPARFAWLYDLVRAFVLTGDRRYAEAAAERIAGWDAACPKFEGVHWSCGQETAIRAVALLHAEAVLADAWDEATCARVARLLGASGERIADAVGYAVSQRNNHAISEATGLVLLGDRLRGAHPEAGGWLQDGHQLLEQLVREQFGPDGWYIQHSFVYKRLAVEQCVLAECALRSCGRALSGAAADRLRAAVTLFLAVIDGPTGDVPNHGANDGAFVWHTTLAPFRDFRPVVTAAATMWDVPVPEDVPLDDERLAWMGAPPPPSAPPRGDGVRSGASGWAVARVGETVAFLRAGRYTARPGHLDPLHLNVRIGGDLVVVDPGTFAYNAPAPWRNGLAGAAVHNGPLLDGVEPGVRGPRFLWYLWPEADVLGARLSDGVAVLEAERPGAVRRTVRVEPGRVVVEDRALDPEAGRVSVRWTLAPGVALEAVAVEGGVVRAAREGAVEGWVSLHYGERIPSQSVEADAPAGPSHTIVTTIQLPTTS